MGGTWLRGVSLGLTLALLVVRSAGASAADDAARRRGSCSGGPGEWELVVKDETARTMRIRFEIEDGHPDDAWQLFVSVDGRRVLAETKRADGGGSVRVVEVTADPRGVDRIKASGVDVDAGGSCEGSIRH